MSAFTAEPLDLLGIENTMTVAYNIVTSAPPRTQMRRPQDHYKYVVFIFGFITFCCGIIGNSLVIYILLRFRDVRVKSVANYYILNLAFSDQAFILSMPFLSYSSFVGEWIFGNPMCKITYVLREINKFASIFTLVALSIDRYLASFHNLGHLRTIRVGKFVCLLIWTSSLAMCMPYIMYSHSIFHSRGGNSCKINWPKPILPHLRAWIYSQFSLGLVLPFALICISYILLIRRLRAIMKPRGADRIRKPNRKMTQTVMVVFTTFLICQLPYHVVEILNLRKMEQLSALPRGAYVPTSYTTFMLYLYGNVVSQILLFISSCCNPILYGVTNENYRKLYKMALCCGRRDEYMPANGMKRPSVVKRGSQTTRTVIADNGNHSPGQLITSSPKSKRRVSKENSSYL